jgi:ATP-dependent protease HslVU (ClpYQ) peptidase subunit
VTTIAVRDGVMAADTRVGNGGWVTPGAVKKLHRLDNGWAIGMAGVLACFPLVRAWVNARIRDGERGGSEFFNYPLPEIADDYNALVMRDDGSVFGVEGKRADFVDYDRPFAACGSGRIPALAAMLMGATAEEAVRIAMQPDPETGGEVMALRPSP